jgi:hypothetical protein
MSYLNNLFLLLLFLKKNHMCKYSLLFLFSLSLISCSTKEKKVNETNYDKLIQIPDTSDMTNNFYDNTETFSLPLNDLTIDGEISNPGKVDFPKLQLRSVIVKETLLDSAGGDRFVGAYRYDGYSLFDLLNDRILKKANSEEFNPIIDLYVEIENRTGEKVVFSWGEIYYPNNLHKILIASSVSRIVPSKTKKLWPLPEVSKIVAASDLVTERNISEPVRITVKSIRKSFPVVKGISPMYSKEIKLYDDNKQLGKISPVNEKEDVTFYTIFYGRGKGIHSTSPFNGMMLRNELSDYYKTDRQNLKTGIICIAGLDGYRCAVSFSELFNRNDQQEFLLVRTEPDEDGGLFRIFVASDFFSDRAIKSVSEIHLLR